MVLAIYLASSTTSQGQTTMNSDKILELYLDGAYLINNRLYHPSFTKGSRKVSSLSALSAKDKLAKLGKLSEGEVNGEWVVKAI
jgi:hypothetical protein